MRGEGGQKEEFRKRMEVGSTNQTEYLRQRYKNLYLRERRLFQCILYMKM